MIIDINEVIGKRWGELPENQKNFLTKCDPATGDGAFIEEINLSHIYSPDQWDTMCVVYNVILHLSISPLAIFATVTFVDNEYAAYLVSGFDSPFLDYTLDIDDDATIFDENDIIYEDYDENDENEVDDFF